MKMSDVLKIIDRRIATLKSVEEDPRYSKHHAIVENVRMELVSLKLELQAINGKEKNESL